ncbi:MAG: hypothetical protein HY043_21325 [Verrucomicrobia bacterium]|nr:hypothetical protein [Verrucomicrobiota bacterium]
MYWKYFLKFMLADFLCTIVFTFVVVTTLVPLAFGAKVQTAGKILAVPVIVVSGAAQIYFWGFWAAFCSGFAAKYSAMPTVSHRWLYYVTAFFFCTAPLGWLSLEETQVAQSSQERRGIERGTTLYSLVAIAAFLVFCFWPALVEWPYAWALSHIL